MVLRPISTAESSVHRLQKLNLLPSLGSLIEMGNNMLGRGSQRIYFEGRQFDNSQNGSPFSIQVGRTQSAGQAAPVMTTDAHLPAQSPTGNFSATNPLITYNVIPSQLHGPYVQQHSLSVEQELALDTSVELNYTGTKETHTPIRSNIAQVYSPADPAACHANNSAPGCLVGDRETFTNFSAYVEEQFEGYSNYNAGTVKLTHRSYDLAVADGSYLLEVPEYQVGDRIAGYRVAAVGKAFRTNYDLRADWRNADAVVF